MKFLLLSSTPFLEKTRKLLKKSPELTAHFQDVLRLLVHDPFSKRLRTHQLRGELQNSYACRVTYKIKIVFKLVRYQQQPAILLESISSDREIY